MLPCLSSPNRNCSRWIPIRFWFSLRIMQAHRSFAIWLNCFTHFKNSFHHSLKVPQHCCLLPSVACFIILSICIVQFSRCRPSNLFQGQIETFDFTQMLQSNLDFIAFMEVSFAHFLFQKKVGGGPKWTRTTDLTIISRAL